jgi:hypothetical protein
MHNNKRVAYHLRWGLLALVLAAAAIVGGCGSTGYE